MKKISLYLLIILILCTGLFATIILNIHHSKLVIKVQTLRKKLKTIEQENNELELSIARNQSYAKLEKYAKNNLGMISPSKVEFIVIDHQI